MKVDAPLYGKTDADWLVRTGARRDDGTEIVIGVSPHLTEEQALAHARRILKHNRIVGGRLSIRRRNERTERVEASRVATTLDERIARYRYS